jgi:TPR repeat protein
MAKEILKTGNWFVDQLSLYQSANSDNKSVRKNFVIRQAEFELIISDLKNKKPADPLQHELVLGRRGSGKSTLLKRIQVEIEEDEALQKKYIAINLAEEQAGIYRLFDLWEEVWKELANKYKLDKTLKPYSDFEDDTAFPRYLYAQVHEVLTKEKKKVVLLLDNFDRIVGNFADDGHLLRETLLNYNNIQLIAGSTRMDEHFWQYDKPFYEFFRRHRLEALDIEEIVQLLNHWATVMELPQLADFAKKNIGKLEAIRILTDGLPRTLQFFIQLLLQNDTLHGYDYLRKIMDSVTPLYQKRLNNLPAAQRKIVAEMAFIWEACAVKELVDKCRMESKLISAQIKQLTNLGIVDTISTSKKNHLYRLSERFFNMWLMITQGNPEQKRKAKWLSIFLESWYDVDELQALAGEHIGKLKANKLGYDKALVMAKAFTQSKYITTKQRDEILDLTNQLNEDKEPYGMLELPRKVTVILEEIKQCVTLHQVEKALSLADEIENEADGYKYYVKGHLHGVKQNYSEAEKYYLLAIEKGHTDTMYALSLLYEDWGKYGEAEKYYLLAIEKGHVNSTYNLATLYKQQGRDDEAEKYYLRAIEKGDASAMHNLALLYFLHNWHKQQALQYINQAVSCETESMGLKLQVIIEVWNGVYSNLNNKITQLLTASKYEAAEGLLGSLLYLEQTNLIHQFFTDPIHGPELQKRYQPLYFAVLQLSGNMDADTKLRIPPEILPTVEAIVKEVKEKQRFYAGG